LEFEGSQKSDVAVCPILEPELKSGIKEGIMGTWLEMRQLWLKYKENLCGVMRDLPQDMEDMKKLHNFIMACYYGLSLPNCKFQHLEEVELYR